MARVCNNKKYCFSVKRIQIQSLGKPHFIVNIKKRGEKLPYFEGEQDCIWKPWGLPKK